MTSPGPATLPATLPFTLGQLASYNELTWFTVLGAVYDIENPNTEIDSILPQVLQVSAFVDFFPGNQQESFPAGFTVRIRLSIMEMELTGVVGARSQRSSSFAADGGTQSRDQLKFSAIADATPIRWLPPIVRVAYFPPPIPACLSTSRHTIIGGN